MARLYVCMSTFSKNLLLRNPGPIEVKFHVEQPLDSETKVYSRDQGHMTKMAAMPIYGKNPSKIFFSGTSGPIYPKLSMYYWRLGPIINCSNDEPGMTLTHFRPRSYLVA